MISHGIVSAALFLCVGVVYDRMHTREIAAYGGLVNRMPLYAFVFLVFSLANVGLPGTSGFVGEFLTLIGTFRVNNWVATLATLGTILSAAYALWLYRKVIFGKLEKPSLAAIRDIGWREIAILAPLVVADHRVRRLSEAGARLLVGVGDATGRQLPSRAQRRADGGADQGERRRNAWTRRTLPGSFRCCRKSSLGGGAMALLMVGVFAASRPGARSTMPPSRCWRSPASSLFCCRPAS